MKLEDLLKENDAHYDLANDKAKQGTERVLNLGYIGISWPQIREHLVSEEAVQRAATHAITIRFEASEQRCRQITDELEVSRTVSEDRRKKLVALTEAFFDELRSQGYDREAVLSILERMGI